MRGQIGGSILSGRHPDESVTISDAGPDRSHSRMLLLWNGLAKV